MLSSKDNQDSGIKLSVILPLYNDNNYIRQCVDSVLINNSSEIELIISDDHSFDGSIEICKEYDDERIKIVKPIKHLGAVKNWIFGLSHAKGEYIYFLAGDDYLKEGILDLLINEFDGKSIYTAPINCFNDITKKVIDKQQYPDQYVRMFGENKKKFVDYYLNYYNHDEMCLNFIPKKKLTRLNWFLEKSVSSVFWFWSASVFYNTKIKNIDTVVLFKRYNHAKKRSNWKDSQREVSKLKKLFNFFLSTHIVESFCDVFNCFILAIKLNSLKVLILLLFRSRKSVEKRGGLYGLCPEKWNLVFFRPNVLIEFLISPIIMMKSFLKFLKG
tara:strand:- start:1566 stop:2552 length:987 start_codon:yes stop_codon:yes gene_type:complete